MVLFNLVTIGYLHKRKKPTEVKKAYLLAAFAKSEGAEILYFSPGAVDFQTRSIDGCVYENGRWVKKTSPFPDVIYKAVKFKRDKQIEVVKKLRVEVPFTSHSIGSKWKVYKNLIKYGQFTEYLIPTEKVLSMEQLLVFLDHHGKIVLKPSSGRQGKEVFYIKKKEGFFEIRDGERASNLDFLQIKDFITKKISTATFIMQPYIDCRTKNGNPFDFRLYTQKTSGGEWVTAMIYPRVSLTENIVGNMPEVGEALKIHSPRQILCGLHWNSC